LQLWICFTNGFVTEASNCKEEQQPFDQHLIQWLRSNRDFT
jgi:hypothetical protein